MAFFSRLGVLARAVMNPGGRGGAAEKEREQDVVESDVVRARDDRIASLEQELDALREITPTRIKDYLFRVGQEDKKYNESLKGGLAKAREAIEQWESEIEELKRSEGGRVETLERLEAERDQISKATEDLRSVLKEKGVELEQVSETPQPAFISDPELFREVDDLWRKLRDCLTRYGLKVEVLYDEDVLEDFFSDVYPLWMQVVPPVKKEKAGEAEEPEQPESSGEVETSPEPEVDTGPKRKQPQSRGGRPEKRNAKYDPYQKLGQELIDALRMTTKGDNSESENSEK
ncbi:MAG: hypothetical protein R6U89_02805 [Dehalococcoidia bacterium]